MSIQLLLFTKFSLCKVRKLQYYPLDEILLVVARLLAEDRPSVSSAAAEVFRETQLNAMIDGSARWGLGKRSKYMHDPLIMHDSILYSQILCLLPRSQAEVSQIVP